MANRTCPTPRSKCLLQLFLAGAMLSAIASDALAGKGLSSGGVFGSVGRQYSDFKPIPQWTILLKRYREEQRKDSRCRAGGKGAKCPYTEWMRELDSLKSSDQRTQVDEINRFANRWRYIKDRDNWHVEDYWETPGEFFERSGDCEDYAIVKFMSLRALGFDNTQLRLVAVKDMNLGVGHAITLAEVNGDTLLLDNQIKRVIEATSVRHYKPIYSANENAWWLYR